MIIGMGPEKTIDGSGIDALDQHSTIANDMWLSGMGDPSPTIKYEFTRAHKLHEMWVWNSNQMIESFVGLGAKDVTIETSMDGNDWTVLAGVTQLAQAPGTAGYTHNNTIAFNGIVARYVRITITSGHGLAPQFGLSEIRSFYIPTLAREPQPADGQVDVPVDAALAWRAGREAATHQLVLSTDPIAVTEGTAPVAATDTSSFDPGGLNLASSYYWRVDEINEAETPSLWTGDIWSFSTADFVVVDDFDQYDDACMRIFFAWGDGLGHNGGEEVEGCDVPPSNGNGGGSIVGHAMAPFAEKTIVNVDSRQSLPLEYDNAFGLSETTLMPAGQDWTASGIQTLSLSFYGQPDNSGQLYVKINNNKVVYDGDITQEQWQPWNIDLTPLAGLQNVTTLIIGVDGANAAGMLYIDDIRLYP